MSNPLFNINSISLRQAALHVDRRISVADGQSDHAAVASVAIAVVSNAFSDGGRLTVGYFFTNSPIEVAQRLDVLITFQLV